MILRSAEAMLPCHFWRWRKGRNLRCRKSVWGGGGRGQPWRPHYQRGSLWKGSCGLKHTWDRQVRQKPSGHRKRTQVSGKTTKRGPKAGWLDATRSVSTCINNRSSPRKLRCCRRWRFALTLDEDFINTFIRGGRIKLEQLVTEGCQVCRQLARFLLRGDRLPSDFLLRRWSRLYLILRLGNNLRMQHSWGSQSVGDSGWHSGFSQTQGFMLKTKLAAYVWACLTEPKWRTGRVMLESGVATGEEGTGVPGSINKAWWHGTVGKWVRPLYIHHRYSFHDSGTNTGRGDRH